MPQPPQSRSHWLAVATVLGGGTVCCCLSPVFRRALQLSLFLGALVAFPFLASFSIARARQQPKTSDGSASPTATKARRKRLKFSTPAAFDSLSRKQAWEREAAGSAGRRTESLHPSLPASVNSAVDRLLAQILSHFLLSWWTPLTSPLAPPTFPNAVESTIRTTLSNVLRRVEEVDWPSLVVAQVLPLTTSHITRFKQAGGLSASASDPSSSSAAAEDLLLSQAYAALLDQGKLHPAVNVASANTRPSEERFLQDLIGRILPLVLPSEEAKSPAVVTIVRELVASTILLPVVDMVCDADFWNVLIDTKVCRTRATPRPCVLRWKLSQRFGFRSKLPSTSGSKSQPSELLWTMRLRFLFITRRDAEAISISTTVGTALWSSQQLRAPKTLTLFFDPFDAAAPLSKLAGFATTFFCQ